MAKSIEKSLGRIADALEVIAMSKVLNDTERLNDSAEKQEVFHRTMKNHVRFSRKITGVNYLPSKDIKSNVGQSIK